MRNHHRGPCVLSVFGACTRFARARYIGLLVFLFALRGMNPEFGAAGVSDRKSCRVCSPTGGLGTVLGV